MNPRTPTRTQIKARLAFLRTERQRIMVAYHGHPQLPALLSDMATYFADCYDALDEIDARHNAQD